MRSRLLQRLDAGIAAATQPLAADCLRCERAAYLARVGDFDQATRELATVQQRHRSRPNAAVSAWPTRWSATTATWARRRTTR